MNLITKTLAVTALLSGIWGGVAEAKTDGILVVGTQAEVNQILSGSKLTPVFSEENPDAMVAVRLSHGKMSVYEGECAHDVIEGIIRLGGRIVKGGVVFTLKVGSALWDLLEHTACFVVHVGEASLKAACWVLSHATCVVVNGVRFVAHTVVEVLRAIADLLHCSLHCPRV